MKQNAMSLGMLGWPVEENDDEEEDDDEEEQPVIDCEE